VKTNEGCYALKVTDNSAGHQIGLPRCRVCANRLCLWPKAEQPQHRKWLRSLTISEDYLYLGWNVASIVFLSYFKLARRSIYALFQFALV
jgi:hypothetical protein